MLDKQLAEQRVVRKGYLKRHKDMVSEFSAHVRSQTPDAPTRLPTKEELNEIANLEDSDEIEGFATQVLKRPEPPSPSGDSIVDGFAALKAQKAQRRLQIRELKRAAASCKVARTRTGRINGEGSDVC